ncbi:MAG: hypothetical protein ACHQIO_17620, partial [Nevskiales bacterium]
MTLGRRLHQKLLWLGLAAFTLVNLIPILWGLIISLKQPSDAFTIPPMLIFSPTLNFHYEIWFRTGFPRYLLNTVVIALATVAISVPIASLAAYGLTRTRSRAAPSLLFGLLAVRMLPQIL